jgi:hypothetical protein
MRWIAREILQAAVGQLKGKRIYIAGPCEQSVQIIWRMHWAHTRDCSRNFTGCCWPAGTNRQGETHSHCGPMREVACDILQAAVGQLNLIGKWKRIYWRIHWAHARDCAQKLTGCRGPAQPDRQGEAHLHCGPMRTKCPNNMAQQGQFGVFVIRQSLGRLRAVSVEGLGQLNDIGSTASDFLWAIRIVSAVPGDWPTQCHRYHPIHD